MKQIKFRIWDKLAKSFKWSLGEGEKRLAFKIKADISEGHFEITDYESADIEMFSGLFDRDGGEIYDGDILAVGPSKTKGDWLFSFSALENWCDDESPKKFYGDLRIIGNIHENPEFLNKWKN